MISKSSHVSAESEELKCYEENLISPEAVETPSKQIMAFQDKNLSQNERLIPMMMTLEKFGKGSMVNYFQTVQNDLTPQMRRDVAIWMFEVCEEEKQATAVFLRAIQYLDTFLSKERIARNHLQLLGAVCILISSKLSGPSVSARSLVDFSANSLTTELLIDWEILVLSKLQWDMNEIVSSDFVPHILNLMPKGVGLLGNTSKISERIKTFVCYCAVDYQFGVYLPSTLASAAIVVALTPYLNVDANNEVISTVQQVLQVDLEELKKCTDQIDGMIQLTLEGKNLEDAKESWPGNDPNANGGGMRGR